MNLSHTSDDKAIESWVNKWKCDCETLIEELDQNDAAEADKLRNELNLAISDQNGMNERAVIESIFEIKHEVLKRLGR